MARSPNSEQSVQPVVDAGPIEWNLLHLLTGQSHMITLGLRDLMPKALRHWWRHIGPYPDRDLFTLFDEQAHTHPQRQAVWTARACEPTVSCRTPPCG